MSAARSQLDAVSLEVRVVGFGGNHARGVINGRGGASEGRPPSSHHHLHRLQGGVVLAEHAAGDAVAAALLPVLAVGRAVVVPRGLPREAVGPLHVVSIFQGLFQLLPEFHFSLESEQV